MFIIRGTVGLVPRAVKSVCRAATSTQYITTETTKDESHIKDTAGVHSENDTDSTTRYKVYTRTGDGGTSSLYNGKRATKDESTFWALGETDELNNAVGVAREFCTESSVKLPQLCSQLEEIQSRLLDVGSAVATPLEASSRIKIQKTRFEPESVTTLESWIDAMDTELPALTAFILPSGGRAAVFLHVARGVCRRAERQVVPLVREGRVEKSVGMYLNRLSDYLFTAARYAAHKEGRVETTYKKGTSQN
mmetsp:Transcript_23842/g.32784  ORF Transcript_23842/g.32784 Transcript_23842/m.32784 type:complete len:250 (+) Transcript_23842:137-886(+)|eukprot:CAMPEP_0196586224 /NCGR_PEP_ID=MMETSP1081-20130531/53537_1 /TAXON_ID=36882 /ORGANISM="Pyramimonas amylifera, Strain CCMP720" /LENGTH=249 /DNA_ID=CAMNT_0041908025 /DNA_START=127 /DNA_END=876 /DNA_ORIENTATION=+